MHDIRITNDITLEIRCPHCDNVMVIKDQIIDGHTITIRLEPCEYCEEGNEYI